MAVESVPDIVVENLGRACRMASGHMRADTDLLELGIDSLSLIGVINSVFIHFDIATDDEAVARLLLAQTVGEFAAITEGLVSGRS